MSWLKKIFGSLPKGPTPRERAIEFIKKICEELENLGETITYSQEYSEWRASTANGLRKIAMDTFAEFGHVHVRISPLYTGDVGGSEGSIHIDHNIKEYFLNGREESEIIYPEQFGQKDPREIAKRFLDLAIEFSEIFIFLLGIEVRTKEAKAAIDKEAANKKAEVDRQARKQIAILTKDEGKSEK